MSFKLSICLLLLVISLSHGWQPREIVHVQTLDGMVGAENFTYYRLSFGGRVLVKLQSIEGDADLYLSTNTMRPSWSDYTMKSASCGEDEVIVEPHEPRPVGLGVYGYVLHPISKFRLSIFLEKSETYDAISSINNKQNEEEWTPMMNQKVEATRSMPHSSREDTDGISLWNIFLGFMQIVFDIIIS